MLAMTVAATAGNPCLNLVPPPAVRLTTAMLDTVAALTEALIS